MRRKLLQSHAQIRGMLCYNSSAVLDYDFLPSWNLQEAKVDPFMPKS